MISCSVGIDDVEDPFARDDETVAETLAFRTRLAAWVLASIVASDITDDVRVWRLGEDEGWRVVRFIFLQSGCEI